MSMTMIERVAEAIKKCDKNMTEFRNWEKIFAKAAIETMREPTNEMIKAGFFNIKNGTVEEVYQVMIDAALKE